MSTVTMAQHETACNGSGQVCTCELRPRDVAGHTAQMVTGNPVVQRRALGKLLAEARRQADLSRDRAARELEISLDGVGRIERGDAPRVKLRDVLALLRLYRVDPALKEQCVALWQGMREPGWWAPYSSAIHPQYARLLGLEDAAREMRTYQSSVVPGILQTPEYARAIISASVPTPDPAQIEDRVTIRQERQVRLLVKGAPRLHAVIDEGALMRRIGGVPVWREQLQHLAKLSADPAHGPVIQILRLDTAPPVVNGSFMLLRLSEPEDTWVAYTESPVGNHYLEGDDQEVYQTVFQNLIACAGDPRHTPTIINMILEGWDDVN